MMMIKELDRLRQEQIPDAVGPMIPTNGLLVHLNANTMFSTGTTLATDGQSVENWGNVVTGNSISAATQSIATDRPIMNIVNGIKQLDFGASGSVRLTLGQPTELNFPSATGRYTFMAQCGVGLARVFWWSNLTGSGTTTGQGAFDFFGASAFYADGQTFRNIPEPTPSVPTTIAVSRGITNENVRLYINGILRDTQVTTGSIIGLTNDWIIGASNGSTSNSFEGGMRNFVIYDRVLTDQEVADINTAWTT